MTKDRSTFSGSYLRRPTSDRRDSGVYWSPCPCAAFHRSDVRKEPPVTGEATNEWELGIGIVPYNPLGRGFFGGKRVVETLHANSFLPYIPRFQVENLDKNKALYLKIEKLAEKHGCTPAQLALAWVLHQGDDVAPIPGTTKIKNLDSNIDSLKVKLTKEDLKEISDAVPINEVAGDRLPEGLSQFAWKFGNTPPKGSKVST